MKNNSGQTHHNLNKNYTREDLVPNLLYLKLKFFMKNLLIFIQIIAITLLFLNFFDVVTNQYLPVVCFTIILMSLILTLWIIKNEK